MTALITREGLARLDAALAWIDEHPEQHDQDMWIRRTPECGTTYCLAGVVAIQAGGVPLYSDDEQREAARVSLPDGGIDDVANVAHRLLEVDWSAASFLFYTANDRADLGEYRDRLAASLDGTS